MWPDKSDFPGLEMLISPICSLIHVRNVRLVYIAQPSLIVAFLLQLQACVIEYELLVPEVSALVSERTGGCVDVL